MLKSMTAYGRAARSSALGRIVVEISSVNRRFLEVNSSLPRELVRYDVAIKKRIAEKLGRGQVSLRVSLSYDEQSSHEIVPNTTLAKKIRDGWCRLCRELGIEPTEASLLTLLQGEPALLAPAEAENDGAMKEVLFAVLDEAMEQLEEMKAKEGNVIQEEISGRLQCLEELLEGIVPKSAELVEHYRKKITDRIAMLGSFLEDAKESLLREVCLFAEKVDISEEITRLRAHLSQMRQLVDGKALVGGKKMEFFIQEAQREMTTIAAKGNDLRISHATVEMRSELEKIREQIQNAE